MHIERALEKFTTQLAGDGRAEATIAQYSRHVRSLVRWLETEKRSSEVQAIDHEVLAKFLASPAARQRSDGSTKRPRSGNALRSSLRCLFKYLHDAGFIRENPARLVRQAKCSPPPPRALGETERERLLAVLANANGPHAGRDRALFGTMLHSGTRLGATLRLEAQDVDLEQEQLLIRGDKGGQSNIVLLGPDAVAALRPYLVQIGGYGLLFPGREGRPMCRRHAQRRFRILAKRAGISDKASPHALRHAFASSLLARTNDVALLQKALGHRSIASTMVYASVPDERLRQALRS